MGPLGRQRPDATLLPEAGELVPVEALSRDGVLVTSEGALVRYLRVTAKNPLVMAEAEREQVGEAFGQMASRVAAGQALQFYVEAAPVQLEALLVQSREEAARAREVLIEAGEAKRADALRRLHEAHEESLIHHADAQAAVAIAYFVVVPYVPDQAAGPDWRALLPGHSRKLPSAPLERSLDSHRRVLRESLYLSDAIRSDLEALDLSTHLLSGPEVLDLLWRRCNPTTADRTPERAPGARESRLEVLGELDAIADAREAAEAARQLREIIAASAHESPDQRYLRVDRDLEQVLYVAAPPDATYFGWLLNTMQVQRPFALTVHIHALDRIKERNRHKTRHRRLFGVNRGAELRGRVADYEMLAQEEEAEALLKELGGQERAAVYELSIYQSVREPGPEPDARQLAEAVEQAAREITATSDARVSQGQLRQPALWQSSLPLGRDEARRTRKYVTRHVGDSVPLIGTSCGSPTGIPFAFTEPGRTVELINPFDPAHDNATMLVSARSGGGKTFAVNVILSRLLAHGMRAFVIDRAGHYENLCQLVPGAQHLTIGSSADDHAVNPWDTPDPSRAPIEKVTFLVALHSLLIGDERAGAHGGVDALERNLLEVAIRGVYERAAAEGCQPRESMLRQELRQRADEEGQSGADEVASTLRTLSERLASFCGEGSYSHLLDRDTTIPEDAPLTAFDTRSVPRGLEPAVLFMLVEHCTRKIERRRDEGLLTRERGMFTGRSTLVIDEAWRLVQHAGTGEFVNDLARRARHLGLFLVAISQQLSDFGSEHGRALVRNSTMTLMLRQAPDELAHLSEALRLSDEEIRVIARLKTVKRAYSQAYWINGTRGRGTIALRVGPREYWLATSDPVKDAPLRAQALEQTGGDAWAALELLAAHRLEGDE
ncbi:MAG: hypothetical protein WKF96_15250 [Solirubrobacteraceae bacterium]